MRIYLLRDTDPLGGYFAAQQFKPDITQERETVVEVRATTIPDDLWRDMLAGILPVDEDDSNDSTWVEWWPEATTVWSRS
jgi:hypothetical protein